MILMKSPSQLLMESKMSMMLFPYGNDCFPR